MERKDASNFKVLTPPLAEVSHRMQWIPLDLRLCLGASLELRGSSGGGGVLSAPQASILSASFLAVQDNFPLLFYG